MRGRCFVVGVHFLALRFSENSSGWSSNNYIGAKISTCLQIILFKNKTWNGRCAQSHAGGLQNPNQDLRLLPELSKLLWGLNEKCAGRKEKPPWMFCAATGLSGGSSAGISTQGTTPASWRWNSAFSMLWSRGGFIPSPWSWRSVLFDGEIAMTKC